MKSRFLRLDKPCHEEWNNMTPNEKGKYCASCSKNVVDFTSLNLFEISDIMKKSGNKICARLTNSQLNSPLLDLDHHYELNIPVSKVAVGLILATSLATGQNSHIEQQVMKTEFVQSSESIPMSSREEIPYSNPDKLKPNDKVAFKGIVISHTLGKPVENAKIMFVTSQKILSTYTSKDGTFSLEIPSSLIDNDNVIRVSYSNTKTENEDKKSWGYATKSYILSKEQLKSDFSIITEPILMRFGGISYYSQNEDPVVLNNGIEIKYSEFMKAQFDEESSCNLKKRNYMYFSSEFAIAIYGEKAKHGLYILTDETEE